MPIHAIEFLNKNQLKNPHCYLKSWDWILLLNQVLDCEIFKARIVSCLWVPNIKHRTWHRCSLYAFQISEFMNYLGQLISFISFKLLGSVFIRTLVVRKRDLAKTVFYKRKEVYWFLWCKCGIAFRQGWIQISMLSCMSLTSVKSIILTQDLFCPALWWQDVYRQVQT